MPSILVLLALTAQVAPPSPQTLERVREGLAAPPPRLTVPIEEDADARPRFRLSIEAVKPIYLDPPWEPDKTIPLYVRSTRPLYHHEFLTMVTPEEFRAGALYPGVDLWDALSREISGEMRQIRERRAREEVRKQHELFKASIAKPQP